MVSDTTQVVGREYYLKREETNIQVQLINPMVLNLYTAKQLTAVLTRVVAVYESRLGTVPDEAKLQCGRREDPNRWEQVAHQAFRGRERTFLKWLDNSGF